MKPRHHLRRRPDRGSHDRRTIDAILDEALVCHLGLVIDGQPFVVPHSHWRVGDEVMIHCAANGRVAAALAAGAEACLTATLLDGLVLARSAYHHSMNYRSVMVFGRARVVEDPVEKAAALAVLIDKMAPGRAAEARAPDAGELAVTAVLAFPLGEASAKARSGPPVDAPADRDWPVWAGVVPLTTERGEPQPG